MAFANLRFTRPSASGDVCVDRASGSAMGNPFRTIPGVSRDAACDAFRLLLRAPSADDAAPVRIAAEMELPPQCVSCDMCAPGTQAARIEAVAALGRRIASGQDVRLLCWCFPRRCHAECIACAAREIAGPVKGSARKRTR